MARRESPEDEERPLGLIASLIYRIADTLLAPIRIATSKIALRAYVTSILFVSTAFVLFIVAIIAYTLFYWSYIPRIGFERVVHLQFDPLPIDCTEQTSLLSSVTATKCTLSHPWGIVTLIPDLVSVQRYDVKVVLNMPRTPTNTGMGNFMLDVKMFAPGDKGSSAVDLLKNGIGTESAQQGKLLAQSRRPAILTYYSKPVDLVQKAVQLHWYLLGWRHEAETLSVDMFENVEFSKGWRNVPSTLRLDVQSTTHTQMQIYGAKVMFRARFGGLRWFMYNHRITSACLFIGSFWVTEVVFTALAWLVLGWFIFGGKAEAQQASLKAEQEDDGASIKEEGSVDGLTHLSDTERTFPTYGSQPPLRYESRVKKEERRSSETESLAQLPTTLATEADDEDEDADFVLDEARWHDSGIGTSMESSAGRNEPLRRRRSRPSSSSSKIL